METHTSSERQRLTARVPQAAHDVISRAAEWRGISVNSFIVQAAVKEAEEVIEREKKIRLSEAGFRRMAELIENPPKPNEAMLRDAQRNKELISE